jgi:hypothetical protein
MAIFVQPWMHWEANPIVGCSVALVSEFCALACDGNFPASQMSPFGTKQKSQPGRRMSAFGGKADIVTPERIFTRSARGYGATQAGNLRNTFAHPRTAIFCR